MNSMPQPWRQPGVSAKLSSHAILRAAVPRSAIERNGLLDMLHPEPRLPNRPVVRRRHAVAALSAGKKLILAGRNLMERRPIPVG
jgi:hypothetical protein